MFPLPPSLFWLKNVLASRSHGRPGLRRRRRNPAPCAVAREIRAKAPADAPPARLAALLGLARLALPAGRLFGFDGFCGSVGVLERFSKPSTKQEWLYCSVVARATKLQQTTFNGLLLFGLARARPQTSKAIKHVL